jgi:hypothetical protein
MDKNEVPSQWDDRPYKRLSPEEKEQVLAAAKKFQDVDQAARQQKESGSQYPVLSPEEKASALEVLKQAIREGRVKGFRLVEPESQTASTETSKDGETAE